MSKVSRLHRLLKIIALLQGGAAPSARDIANEMEISIRTVFRDFELLELAGIPFFHDPERQGFRIPHTFFLPPVQLNLEEAMAVICLGEQVKILPNQEAAHAGLLKLRNVLPCGVREALGEILPHISIRTGGSSVFEERSKYSLLCEAIRENRGVRGRYDSVFDKGEIEVELNPYALVFAHRSWYVIGHSLRQHAVRTFKLVRFLSLECAERIFSRPKNFSLEKLLGNSWGIMSGEPDYEVVIRFTGDTARYVRETKWHPTQRIIEECSGNCLWTAKVTGLIEIRQWILSWGPHAEVIKPRKLRKEIKEDAEAMARLYPGN